MLLLPQFLKFYLCAPDFRMRFSWFFFFLSLRHSLRALERMKLFLELFNKVFSFSIFLNKFLTVILSGFSTIRLAHSNPLLAIVYFIITVDAAIAYISIFQLTFQVTGGVEHLKKVIEVKSIGLPFPWARSYLGRILRSIPILAVNVGGFHEAERESVPIFMDFVVKQIVNLLIAF